MGDDFTMGQDNQVQQQQAQPDPVQQQQVQPDPVQQQAPPDPVQEQQAPPDSVQQQAPPDVVQQTATSAAASGGGGGGDDDPDPAQAVSKGAFYEVVSLILHEFGAVQMEQRERLVAAAGHRKRSAGQRNGDDPAWYQALQSEMETASAAMNLPQGVQLGLQVDASLFHKWPRSFWRPSSWTFLSLEKRTAAWEALFNRVLASLRSPSADEMEQIAREYEYLKAREEGMIIQVALFQLPLVVLVSAIWIVLAYYLQTHTWPLNGAVPYLTSAYWGMIGAVIASLWQLVRHSAGRTLRMDQIQSHLLKPMVGAFLGAALYLLVPSGFISGGSNDHGLTLTSVWAVALVAGLFESKVMHKLMDIADNLFGTAQQGGAQSKAK